MFGPSKATTRHKIFADLVQNPHSPMYIFKITGNRIQLSVDFKQYTSYSPRKFRSRSSQKAAQDAGTNKVSVQKGET